MDLRRLIKGVTMGIIEKAKKSRASAQKNIEIEKPELEFLLKLIANSTFQGKDLQLIYDLTVKLQKRLME